MAQPQPGGVIRSTRGALVDSLGREILAYEGIQRRSAADIAHDLDEAQRASTQADQDRAAASQLVKVMESRVEVVNQMIDVAKAQLDLAKKEKREADASRLEALRKQEELGMKYLQRLVDLQQAITDQAAARKDLADARVSAFQLENELEARRTALHSIPTGDPVASSMEKPVRDLEQRTLDKMSEVASKEQDVSAKDEGIVERRIAVFEVTGDYREFLQQPQK
jgi:hypothetical protein